MAGGRVLVANVQATRIVWETVQTKGFRPTEQPQKKPAVVVVRFVVAVVYNQGCVRRSLL